MAGISVGFSCPACGGALNADEGDSTLICNYCNSTLFVEGDKGVTTIAFRQKLLRDGAVASSQTWWKHGWKARDLKHVGKITEAYPIYLPFWKTTTRVAGWICGYNERRTTDSKGNTTVERIPKEEPVLQDYVYSEIACDPGDLGIRTMKNFAGETGFTDFEMIPTFEATTSKDDAVTRSKSDALAKARVQAHVEHVTFEKIHVLPKALTMIYYPIWVVRYNYRDRMYMDTVDGVTGQVLSGRAPGDPMFQSMAVTAGTFIGGLAAFAGIVLGQNDGRIAAAGVAVGLVILFVTYRFFRYGSEIIQGEFKEKKPLLSGTNLKQLTDVTKQLGGLR